ncbi:TMV resistance protein N [Vitis vinifera]|uniref:ADP-ribosyl cyclase/cyclic ADP-ribose hydrolase n=1 Tax=Vitis vinifera TaxID=29760 RepID=A0A438EMB8_VITVI|nr:TMV resistance protein N [Vitis vinifera]
MIKSRLCHKKVLVVLDDADHWSQLKSLVGKRDWFGEGSKIIITTRNKHLLIEHEMDELYEPPMLNTNEALDLFSEYAFRRNHRHDDYPSLSNRIIYYCQGLPFALKVLGSSLFSKTHGQWKSELDKLALEPNMDIINVLRISYEGLSNTQKNIFLDIACFFKGEYKDFVIKILDGCGFFAESGIGVLNDRCLVTILDRKLWMHDLIQQLGWEIVREQGYTNIGRRSRLWNFVDVQHMLIKKTGTNAIEGIFLDLPKSCQINFTTEALAMMTELRLLKIKIIELNQSKGLIRTPNFLSTPNLERLILQGCTSLLEVHPSIGDLEKLHLLDLKDCKSLESVPDGICKLKSLETLSLSGCSQVMRLPKHFGPLKNLKVLSLHGCYNCEELPSLLGLCSLNELELSHCFLRNDAIPVDFWCLSSLQKLNLSGNNFTVIPEGITQLSKLRVLQLGHCYMLQEMPQLPSSIQEVDANSCMSLRNLSTPSRFAREAISPTKTLMETILERIQYFVPDNEFCILLPGKEVPNWFNHQAIGSSITIELSPDWYYSNFLGFAVCFVFTGKPATHSEISCQSNNFSFFYSYPDPQTAFSSYHVWLAYQPRSRVDICHPDEWTDIKASFEINAPINGPMIQLKGNALRNHNINMLLEGWISMFSLPIEVFNPEKFKMPDIDKYDGTGCSKTHLQLFFLKSRFYGAHSEADGLYLTSSQLPLP